MGKSLEFKKYFLFTLTVLFTLGFSTLKAAEIEKFNEIKVALLGDTGADQGFGEVLKLVSEEDASVVMINGDLGYNSSPEAWEKRFKSSINTNLHAVIGSLGNHDTSNKDKYISIFQSVRNDENGLKTKCTGTPGVSTGKDITLVDETCTFDNVSIVSSGIGQVLTKSYLENRLDEKLKNAPTENWKLVGYHFTLSEMNPGLKMTEASYKFFNIIRKHGAIGAQAHTHSVMSSCPISSEFGASRAITCHPDFTDLENRFILPGVSVFMDSSLSGKVGRSRRKCSIPNSKDCLHMVDLITKEGYTRIDGTKNSNFKKIGAVFITFNYQGDPTKAFVYFKSVDGQIIFKYMIHR